MLKEKILKIVFFDDIGRGKVMARALGILSQATIFFTFLKVYGVDLRLWQMFSIGIIWIILEVLLGYLYVKFHLLKMETEFMNDNNPLLKKLENNIKEAK